METNKLFDKTKIRKKKIYQDYKLYEEQKKELNKNCKKKITKKKMPN